MTIQRITGGERSEGHQDDPSGIGTFRETSDDQNLHRQLLINQAGFERLTHYVFRYPAKFHPPVAKTLLERYSHVGGRVLDPFCGSGTLLVEAAVLGRNALGTDIDPVAVFVSRVKTHRHVLSRLVGSCEELSKALAKWRSPDQEYERRQFEDITTEEALRIIEQENLWVPQIPNLFHWFRRYVVIDLARILGQVKTLPIPQTQREFFLLCFASIIRGASNADPVPVSGLEVTSYMKRKEAAGRVINPFALFEKAVKRTLIGASEFGQKMVPGTQVTAIQVDATNLRSKIRVPIDLVITSPPYHNAVDYYRRHQLEMYWLGFTTTEFDRRTLRRRYIGGPGGTGSLEDWQAFGSDSTPKSALWETRMREVSPQRASEFRRYIAAMSKVFMQLSSILHSGSRAVFVVGHSAWNGNEIPTSDLFEELSFPCFTLEDQLWYPVKNRYMSYARHNGASIDKEYVLVFKRMAPC